MRATIVDAEQNVLCELEDDGGLELWYLDNTGIHNECRLEFETVRAGTAAEVHFYNDEGERTLYFPLDRPQYLPRELTASFEAGQITLNTNPMATSLVISQEVIPLPILPVEKAYVYMRAMDDFEEIRKSLRENAKAEGRCTCPKNDSGGTTGVDDLCPAHGKWLGEIAPKS